MAAPERRTFLGCLFLILIQTAITTAELGRGTSTTGTYSTTGDSPFSDCGDLPWGVGPGASYHFLVKEFCCPETEAGQYGLADWPMTQVNQWATLVCPYGADPDSTGANHGIARASRRCAFSPALGPVWREADYSKCRTKGTIERDAADAASSAESMTSDPSKIDSAAFQEATDLIFEAFEVAKSNRAVARSMMMALSNLVATSPSVQAASDADGSLRRRLFRLMEEHGRTVRFYAEEDYYEHQLPNLHLAVFKMAVAPDGTPKSIPYREFNANYAGGLSGVSVHLSAEVIDQALAAYNATLGEELRVRFMALRNAHLLDPPGSLSGTQQVVTAGVSQGMQDESEDQEFDLVVSGLRQPLSITMPLSTNSMGTTHVCAYFDEINGVWKRDGLKTKLDGLSVVCESTHLTPFTLLLDPNPRQSLADMEHALTIVGSLGSSLSVVGLAITIITYRFFSRFSQDRWGRVLVQLCLSLLFLHLTYLASNLKGVLPPACCVAVAVAVHATLLASFCWMFIEGLLLYEILVTVFRRGETKFILKRLVFGWGAPVVLVAVNAAVRPNYYLDTHPDYCLVSGADRLQHILSTLVPCGVIMLLNFGIFIRVAFVLLRQRQVPGVRDDAGDRPRVTWAQIRGVVGVAFLLGVTWPLSPIVASEPMMGITSSVLNAFQGVAIFISRVLTHPEARRCWTQRFFTGSRDFGSSASYTVNDKGSSWLCMRWSSSKKNIASLPKDRQSIVNGARPWSRGDSSNNFSSTSSAVVLSKSTSDTDILY